MKGLAPSYFDAFEGALRRTSESVDCGGTTDQKSVVQGGAAVPLKLNPYVDRLGFGERATVWRW